MKKINAFTLAEVLIAMAIVGAIAAMTIPHLQSSMSRQANAQACKKAYVFLSDVMEIQRSMGEDYEKWDYVDAKTDEIINKLKPYLHIIKSCNSSSGCWSPNVKALNGGVATNFSNQGYGTPARSFKLADGSNLTIDIMSDSFNVTRKRMNTLLFAVDVNGDRKPNKLGEDIFIFILGDNGVFPAGNDATGKGNCHSKSQGSDCAARVVREGVIDY